MVLGMPDIYPKTDFAYLERVASSLFYTPDDADDVYNNKEGVIKNDLVLTSFAAKRCAFGEN